MMKNDELIEQVNTIIDCINSGGTLPVHSSAILMNMVLKFKQYSEAQWISVDDKEPDEHNEWVLGYVNGMKRPMPCYYDKNVMVFRDADGFAEPVTYWQPLPDAPIIDKEAEE